MLRVKECVPNSLLFCCFHLRFIFESIKELGSVLVAFFVALQQNKEGDGSKAIAFFVAL